MKLKKLAEVTMWLPGFAPDDPLPEARCTAEIIPFPLVNEVHDAVPVIDEGSSGDIAERVIEVAADVPKDGRGTAMRVSFRQRHRPAPAAQNTAAPRAVAAAESGGMERQPGEQE